jgi:hypothetical protein
MGSPRSDKPEQKVVYFKDIDLDFWHYTIDAWAEKMKISLLTRTVTIVIGPKLSELKEGDCVIENQDPKDFNVAVGDTVCFQNNMGKSVTITFSAPYIFGVKAIVIAKGACVCLEVIKGTPNQDKPAFSLDCSGNGGGPQFIIVQPPSGDS